MPRKILKCLLPTSAMLKSIDIDLTDHSMDARDGLTEGSTIAKFTKLETLKLDETAFCRHYSNLDVLEEPNTGGNTCLAEIIPGTLKVLAVRLYEGSHLWPDLAELAACSARFPNLKKLTLHAIWRMACSIDRRNSKSKFSRRLRDCRNCWPRRISSWKSPSTFALS